MSDKERAKIKELQDYIKNELSGRKIRKPLRRLLSWIKNLKK